MALDDIVSMGFEYARMVPWMEPKTNKRKRRKKRGLVKMKKCIAILVVVVDLCTCVAIISVKPVVKPISVDCWDDS